MESTMDTRSLPELVQELSPDAQEVVRDLVELLLARPLASAQSKPYPLRQDWADALSAYREQFTSLAFQHRASDWRIEP